jgi:hypothetical protein
MWQLDNRTPFAAERTWVRDRDGAEIWLVAVKASFELQPDRTLKVADEQPPVTLIPVHHGKPGQSSLRYESDLQRTKLSTDIVVIGSAHAPGGQPVKQLDAGFAVGAVAKVLRVFGDRVWRRGSIAEAMPFVAMPLVYERAYGGTDVKSDKPAWDVRNPVGQGYATAAAHLDGRSLPNIEDPRQPIRKWDDRPEPAGFGALACHWQARQRFAGTYGDKWQQERLPLLPDDFDDRHYQFAPADQQSPQWLRGGEAVALRNLTCGGGDVRFVLPRMYLGFETFFYTGPSVRHEPPKLHCVILEPDAARVSLVWHTALPCHPRVLKLKHTRITLKQDLRDGMLAPPQPAELEEA